MHWACPWTAIHSRRLLAHFLQVRSFCFFEISYLLKLLHLGLFPENACVAVDIVLKYWLSLLQVDIHKLLMIKIGHPLCIVLHGSMFNQCMSFLRHVLKSLCIRRWSTCSLRHLFVTIPCLVHLTKSLQLVKYTRISLFRLFTPVLHKLIKIIWLIISEFFVLAAQDWFTFAGRWLGGQDDELSFLFAHCYRSSLLL